MVSRRVVGPAASALALLFALGAASVGGAEPGESAGLDDRTSEPRLFHYAATGAFAHTVQFGAAPITRDRVVVFYMHNFGLYPYIDINTGVAYNGVVPQRTNMTAHLLDVQQDVERAIPDAAWDGLAVIDYEAWTPWWAHTTDRYKEESRAIVRATHPTWSEAQVEQRAKESFEFRARDFMLRTLNKCKAVRPNARWGYWSYPKAEYADDDAQWLWDAQTAFYPSVYMRYQSVLPGQEPLLGQAPASDYIADRLVGRVTYARLLAGERPVHAFAWLRYGSTNPNQWLRLRPLSTFDLTLMLAGPQAHGADGVIVWENLPQTGLADEYQEYFTSRIGPEIQRIHFQTHGGDPGILREDVNRDGIVNSVDLALVMNAFRFYSHVCDINLDGKINTADLTLVLQAFGRTG